ncbi:hypothetical protein [uncultured Eubacterium sp.]|uniref:hypothetical protein n=1 Tax=uncultured Eubacterium sp. TaxID=165185 RepID=UPI0025EBC1B0|nr:hypothetical protein [uncultured Eubacterium sp.]
MRRKFKRPLTFLLALLLLFSLTGASVQAEESENAGASVQVQTVVMQEDGTQKEDDVGETETASTEENVQQNVQEINLTEIQQEEFRNGQNDNLEGEDTLQEKTNAETDQKETLQSDSMQNAENSSAEDAIKTTDSKAENRTGETVNNSDVENNASENAAAVEPQAAGSVSITITDNIENAGTLNAQITGDQPDGITLEWYKHAEGTNTWTKVERHKVTGNSYNVSEDGTALNVALDKGARCFYKVQVKDVSGQLLAESAALLVSYYNQLENGDFESPVIGQTDGYQPYYSNGTSGLIWKTTASDAQIEYVSAATDKFDKNTGKTHAKQSLEWHKVDAAAHGTQFAELNANEPGALYQDVLTTPGAKLYWQLYHRGRGTKANSSSQKDTMYVVIMSTKLAKQYNVVSQSAVQDVITNVRNNTGKYPGASVATITDDNVQWYRHTGDYDVSEGQYLTRFFFVAGETAYDKNGGGDAKAGTVGNHLDNVSFSETLPEPNPDTGHLQIVKTVRGLTEDQAASYQMQVKITGPDQKSETVSLSQFTRNEDGSYSCTYTKTNVAAGTYRIEEILPAALPNYRVDVTFNGTEETGGTITVQDQKTAIANIVNTYIYDIVSPPTGVQDNAIPMGILMGTALGLGVVYLVYSKRRKHPRF